MHTVSYIHHTEEGDSLLAYMARVSNPDNQSNTKTSPKLIKYLIDNKHWSPLEMVSLCVSIKTTRSIAQQIIRHRSFSFQEFSTRYAEIKDPPQAPCLRRQDTSNRQNSIDDLSEHQKESLQLLVDRQLQESYALYNLLLKKGVAKECARDVLPLSTPTRLYMHGNLRSWIHYCQLRSSNGTQHEHKLIADQCFDIIKDCFPLVYASVSELT